MDAQTQILPYFRLLKRLDAVQHIRNEPYFRPGIKSEPDPFDETCSTRKWKFKMKVWVETLKTVEFDGCRNISNSELFAVLSIHGSVGKR